MSSLLRVSKNILFSILFTIIVFVFGMAMFHACDQFLEAELSRLVFIQSWIGMAVLAVIVIQWKRMTNRLVTLYTIFLLFFTVFNFGQCILWAFNIHPENELGKVLMFSSVPCSNLLLVKAQLLFIVSIVCLNCGAVLAFSTRYINSLNIDDGNNRARICAIGSDIGANALFQTCVILSVAVVPATLYKSFAYYLALRVYGYTAIGATVSVSNTVLDILSVCFLPCLLGLIIGSGNKKSIQVIVFLIFGIYAVFATMSGDRGEWITRALVLIWVEFFYYNKISVKKGVKLLVLALIGLWIVQAAISLRNRGGVTLDALLGAVMDSETNPIVSCLVEFGHSMAIVMILLSRNAVYPYGNSYFVSVLTMVSPGLANGLLGTEYVNIQDWFPKDVLHINYGSDFSMIGEAVLNFGPYIAPLIMGIFGFFILKIMLYPYARNVKPFTMCMALNAASVLLKYPRATTWFVLNSIFWGYAAIGAVYFVVKILISSKRYNKII